MSDNQENIDHIDISTREIMKSVCELNKIVKSLDLPKDISSKLYDHIENIELEILEIDKELLGIK